jgi:hypothetical protein
MVHIIEDMNCSIGVFLILNFIRIKATLTGPLVFTQYMAL